MEYIFLGLRRNMPDISILGIYLVKKVEFYWNDRNVHARHPGVYIMFAIEGKHTHFKIQSYHSSGELNALIASLVRCNPLPIEKLHSYYPEFSQELDKQITLALLQYS